MSQAEAFEVPGMVDWDLAVNTARRLTRPGPEVTRSEAEAAVAELRALAGSAAGHVEQITGLVAPEMAPPVRVVDPTALDREGLRERLGNALRELGSAIRGQGGDGQGLLALVQTPAQREVLDRITAFMSLVEGHAEYVMDAVGPDVIPCFATL